MKIIPLTRGHVAFVDDEDFDWLNQWRWHARVEKNGSVYAQRNDRSTGKKKLILMHRQIMGLLSDKDRKILVDHRNGEGFDNQRLNLRRATVFQNTSNKRSYSIHGFKGIKLDKKALTNVWRAAIKVDNKSIHLGSFSTKEDAARAYDVAALKYFGEFATLNFPVDAEGGL